MGYQSLIIGAIAALAVYQLFFAGSGKQDDPPPSRPQPYHRSPSPPLQHQDRVGHQRAQVQREAQTHARSSAKEDRDDRRPPSGPPSHETPQASVPPNDEQAPWQSIDDSDPFVIEDGGVCGICSHRSREALYGDHLPAELPSAKGRRHKQEIKGYHPVERDAIFECNDQGKDPWNIDLHGLGVREAIFLSKTVIADALARGDSRVRLIVGKGNHSEGGISRLKPAVRKALKSHGYYTRVDPRNAGVLIVELPVA